MMAALSWSCGTHRRLDPASQAVEFGIWAATPAPPFDATPSKPYSKEGIRRPLGKSNVKDTGAIRTSQAGSKEVSYLSFNLRPTSLLLVQPSSAILKNVSRSAHNMPLV